MLSAWLQAGLCHQLGDMLNVNMKPELKSFADHISEQAVRNTVDTLLQVTINHAPIDQALEDAIKQIPLKAAAAYAANKICTSYMNAFSRTAVNTALGGLSGFAANNSTQGAVSGALGALTAETLGELLICDAQEINAIAYERLKATGKPITIENMQNAIQEEIQFKAKLIKLAASAVAACAQQNPSIAFTAAANALDNDITIRATLYALTEFQGMVAGTSYALSPLIMHQGEVETLDDESLNNANEDENVRDGEAPDCKERKPFVENPKAGIWFKACYSGDLILSNDKGKYYYLLQRLRWHKDPQCPFNVKAHGSAQSISVDTQDIPVEGLSAAHWDTLKLEGRVNLNAKELARLIRTAPNYKKGQHINLSSCHCGAEPEGLAQQLANEMNVPVSAFTGYHADIGLVAFVSADFKEESWLPHLQEIKTFYPKENTE